MESMKAKIVGRIFLNGTDYLMLIVMYVRCHPVGPIYTWDRC